MTADRARIIHIRRPTWVWALSNAALLREFDVAWDVYGQTGNTIRLDIIGDEISRREWVGTLTDEDWKED